MTIYVVCRMAYKAALIFCILLLSFPAKVGGMFSLIIVMAYVDIIISNRHHITEILLKVALSTNKQTNTFCFI
jgi:hypothetical protein